MFNCLIFDRKIYIIGKISKIILGKEFDLKRLEFNNISEKFHSIKEATKNKAILFSEDKFILDTEIIMEIVYKG